MIRHFRITLRESLLLTAVIAASLAAVVYPAEMTVKWVRALEVILFMILPAIIVGGGWKRQPFAVGFLLGLCIYRFLPANQNPPYVSHLIIDLLPRPTFYGTITQHYWTQLIDAVVGLNLSIACGWIARTASRAAAHDSNQAAG